MTTTHDGHRLICDGITGNPGPRPWHCQCGVKFFGYDGTVREEFAAHRAEQQRLEQPS